MMYNHNIVNTFVHSYIQYIYIASHMYFLIQVLVHLPITVISAKHTNLMPTCKKLYFDSDFLL